MYNYTIMAIQRVKGHGKYATYELSAPSLRPGKHIKLRPASYAEGLTDESQRTNWANHHDLPAPISRAMRLPGIALLLSNTLEGKPSHKYIDTMQPDAIIAGLSAALKIIRDVDASDFPFNVPLWATQQGAESNARTLTSSKHRVLHPDFSQLSTRELRDIVDAGPGVHEMTLNHGDFCMPNVLLDPNCNTSGIVDLGGLHIGSSKLDLAIMSWTIQANMGDRWANSFLATTSTTRGYY